MKTILSVRDFSILYNVASNEMFRLEQQAIDRHYFNWEKRDKKQEQKEKKQRLEELHQSPYYQDLLRIRDKLGELHIEVETPNVEIKEEV